MGQPRLMLAACASGSGKTMITCGILRALTKRGLHVSSFKCGPDYIDPMFHSRVLHTKSRNLDTFFTDREMTRYLFARAAKGTEISVMEGVMGYYDGMGLTSTRASSAELAEVTETPVLLIVNMRGMSLSALALIKGFLTYQRPCRIRGILLNQTSAMVYRKMKEQIERELHIPVYGYVPKVPELTLQSRHLGLVMPDEVEQLNEKLDRLAEVLEETLDIEEILKLAQTAPEVSEEMPETLARVIDGAADLREARPVIAVARDEAFCFLYEDNLKLLEGMGAQLKYFSPIHDTKLPQGAQGLLLYGGYPELNAKALSENVSVRGEIRKALGKGLPCMAECGGFMYLHESMEDMEGNCYPMAGVIEGKAYKTEKLGRFGYIGLEACEKGILGEGMEGLKGHEFHYFDSTSCGDSFLAQKPNGKRSWSCIHGRENAVMGFPHLYYHSCPEFAAEFLRKCARYV
ncbi:MAG: cobyrinate a,c-diamide synthase [Blautia sp.]|nr:cobyrinate a,c-diamide synthase [Blautia sp.]